MQKGVMGLMTIGNELKKLCNELGEKADVGCYGTFFSISVYNRDDLMVCLKLAPKWTKRPGEGCIVYSYNLPDEYIININAFDKAIPPTCKVEETTEWVPPHSGYNRTVRRIVCTTKTEGETDIVEESTPILA